MRAIIFIFFLHVLLGAGLFLVDTGNVVDNIRLAPILKHTHVL